VLVYSLKDRAPPGTFGWVCMFNIKEIGGNVIIVKHRAFSVWCEGGSRVKVL
jgi:hypothetical protein